MGAPQRDETDHEVTSQDPSHRAVHVVIAVKDLAQAKSRLAPAFSSPDRTRLVLAMLSDTVSAAGRVPGVDGVTVVTPDSQVGETARSIGAFVFHEPDDVASFSSEDRLNHAFSSAARWLRRDTGTDIIALQADLPSLRTAELAHAYAAAKIGARSVVVDHHGTGTAALVLKSASGELAPQFGRDSAFRHTGSGAHRLDGDWPGLRLDVDTPEDVQRAHLLGTGPATAGVLRSLGWVDDASAAGA